VWQFLASTAIASGRIVAAYSFQERRDVLDGCSERAAVLAENAEVRLADLSDDIVDEPMA
jgi:hypothetical protein